MVITGAGLSPLGERSEIELEFPEIRKKLEEFCQTPIGRKLAEGLRPSSDPDQVRSWLEETREIRRELEQGWEIPPLASVEDLNPVITRARKEAVLNPSELLKIYWVLDCADSIRRYLKSRGAHLSRVREHFGWISGISGIQDQIRRAIDLSGRIRDEASADLSRLRRRKDSIEAEIKERIQELIFSPELDGVLQEKYFTLRVGRYVLPVKAERRSEVRGIIHDFSSSGATVFVEPETVVDLNNRLRVAEGEVIQEEERILKRLTLLIGEQLDRIEETFLRIGEFDLLLAKGRLSQTLAGGEVHSCDFPHFTLCSGRHPILVLERSQVVANDLILDGEHRGIVISGPNTGGKTVTIKMVGLSAALFQSGIIPALGDGSGLPVFQQILTVIGEEQSLEQGLSAFAAYILRVREVLEKVGPGSLVLLDDLFVGTDPREGASLGRALLRALVERGGVVLATTHLPELKLLPLEDPRFEAVAVAFDLEKMAPTYRIRKGFPGRSYGLEIAERLGLGDGIVRAASSKVGGVEGTLDEVLVRIHRLEDERMRIREEVEAERKKLKETRARLEEEHRKLTRRKAKILAEARKEAQATVAGVEKEAREILKKLAQSQSRKQAGLILQELKLLGDQVGGESGFEGGPGFEPPGVELKPGGVAWVRSLRKPGSILSLGSESSLVRVGTLKIRVRNQELVALAEERGPEAAGKDWDRKKMVMEEEEGSIDFRTEDNTIDLRGETVEDAIPRLERFLDQAFLHGLGQVFVIHGSGSGRLREGIRNYLKDSPYTESFCPADESQGGEGVTVVKLR